MIALVNGAPVGHYGDVLKIQCDTTRFRPGRRNGFKCSNCNQLVSFPKDTTAIVIVAVSDAFTLVTDAELPLTHHDCRVTPEPIVFEDLDNEASGITAITASPFSTLTIST